MSAREDNDNGRTPLQHESVPAERARENIEAWEKKHAAEEPAAAADAPSDDAEAGGP